MPYRYDINSLGKVTKTKQGYLVAPIVIGKANVILTYRRSDGTTVKEFHPKEEVLNKDSIETANKIKNKNVDLIVLDCIGYTKRIKTIFGDITKKPVLLPRTITGTVLKELITK